jgi:magnesium transporter
VGKPSQKKRPRKRRAVVPGTAPGTLSIDPHASKPVIQAFAYSPDESAEREIQDPADIRQLRESWPVVWVNVSGLGDEAILRELAAEFRLHRLVLEDVVSCDQRPKVEPYDDYLFLVARMPQVSDGEETEQFSLFLGDGFLLTFQEQPGDWFDGVRERIRHGGGIVRRCGSDYLAYALLDTLIDAYFPVVERIGDEIEALEEDVLTPSDNEGDSASRIHSIRRRLLSLRRVVSPHREAINALLRDASPFITPETSVYLRDCYDHLMRLTDRLEIYREQCSDLTSTHLNMVSNRMNEVMRVLTVMASIFIPLTFLAGIYGMNFNPEASPFNMPELNWRWGYPLFWAAIVAMAAGMIAFFKRRRWW